MNTHIKSAITLKPFDPNYQEAVKLLILDGLEEHWGSIDPDKNPDLDNICTSYKNSKFITAWQNGELVGTGVLLPVTAKTAKIVRMSVHKRYRRQGIGKNILNYLVNHAISDGYAKLVLETTETWEEAILFYKAYGFLFTHSQDGDTYFELGLSSDSNYGE